MYAIEQGDCLDVMKDLPNQSIDMILTDPPYGTTGIACLNLNRIFIGIEKDEKYFNIAKERIENHYSKLQDG